jgi:drug/metabolite transporter (DMT)-like permease
VNAAHLLELLALAAIWGGSFLFLRVGAGEFGPVPLAFVRMAGAALLLLPLIAWRGEWPALRRHWRLVAIVSLTNSAVPFVCFGVAALAITGGLSSIFNATTPLWGALIAWIWLGDRPGRWRLVGLAIGFAGVAWLAGSKASLQPGEHGISAAWAIAACLIATFLYGWSASFTRKRLAGVPPMVLAGGSQAFGALAMGLPALWTWPAVTPGTASWMAAAGLAVLCSGVAYVLYFRLIAHIGAANAISVTFLIPAFAVGWGALFLGEPLTWTMAGGCAVIVAGTALATGWWAPRRDAVR